MTKIGIFGLNSNIIKLAEKLSKKKIQIAFIIPPPNKKINFSKKWNFGYNQESIPVFLSKNINDKKTIKKIKEQKCDLIINWEHTQIFSEELINSSKLGILNLHRGILPYARGFDPIRGEKLNKINKIGQTIHFITKDIDKGEIISIRKFSNNKNHDRIEIDKIFQNGVVEFYYKAIMKVLKNSKFYKNNKVNLNFGRYYPKNPFKSDIIDWNENSEKILTIMRTASPFEPPTSYLSNTLEEIKILKFSKSYIKNYYSLPGQIIDKNETKGNLIKTGDNAIWLNEIKYKNKIIIPNFPIGTIFVSQWLQEFIKLHNRISLLEQKFK